MERYFVKTIKTWYGRRHAVVNSIGHLLYLEHGVTSYAYSKEGLEQAREAKRKLEEKLKKSA